MPPPGREVQAERPGTLPAYRVRCKPWLYRTPRSADFEEHASHLDIEER